MRCLYLSSVGVVLKMHQDDSYQKKKKKKKRGRFQHRPVNKMTSILRIHKTEQ